MKKEECVSQSHINEIKSPRVDDWLAGRGKERERLVTLTGAVIVEERSVRGRGWVWFWWGCIWGACGTHTYSFTKYIYVLHVHAQSHPTLCDPRDCSLPGSSIHELVQARILEWVAISSPRWSPWSRDWIHVSCVCCIAGRFFTTLPPGKPISMC